VGRVATDAGAVIVVLSNFTFEDVGGMARPLLEAVTAG
jgi:hypothetical protein